MVEFNDPRTGKIGNYELKSIILKSIKALADDDARNILYFIDEKIPAANEIEERFDIDKVDLKQHVKALILGGLVEVFVDQESTTSELFKLRLTRYAENFFKAVNMLADLGSNKERIDRALEDRE